MRTIYRVVAFTDVVGTVCSEECGDAACADIVADYPDSDAGLDPIMTLTKVQMCMGCAKRINPTTQKG